MKKNNYVDFELNWLEEKANEWKQYCDSRPLDKLIDRLDAKGGVISKIEDQIKCIRDTLKDYALLTDSIKSLREKDDTKKTQVRGNQQLNPFESGEI